MMSDWTWFVFCYGGVCRERTQLGRLLDSIQFVKCSGNMRTTCWMFCSRTLQLWSGELPLMTHVFYREEEWGWWRWRRVCGASTWINKVKQLDSVCLSEPPSVILWVSHLFFSSIASCFSFQLMLLLLISPVLPWLQLFSPLVWFSIRWPAFLLFSFVPLCFFCGFCLCRVSCVFLCTSWRSEGSPRWPGPSAPCSTWPRPDTPSPRRQPHLDPPSTSSPHDHTAHAQSASCVAPTDNL